jgi:hypothetical protein
MCETVIEKTVSEWQNTVSDKNKWHSWFCLLPPDASVCHRDEEFDLCRQHLFKNNSTYINADHSIRPNWQQRSNDFTGKSTNEFCESSTAAAQPIALESSPQVFPPPPPKKMFNLDFSWACALNKSRFVAPSVTCASLCMYVCMYVCTYVRVYSCVPPHVLAPFSFF